MAAGTGIMGIRSCAYKRIIMTVSTAGCTNRDARMARIRCMGRLPGARMTGGTIGRGRVANGGADKSSCAGIMTAGTRIMRFWCRTYKGIIMAASA